MAPHRTLTRFGYLLDKEQMTQDEIDVVREELTKTPMVLPAFKDFQIAKPFSVYLETQKNLYVPRYYGIDRYGPPLWNSLPKGKRINVTCTASPRTHQEEAFKKLLLHMSDRGGGVFSVYCGWGKTLTAIMAICKIGLKAMVVVNKEFLMEQWLDSIHRYTNAKTGILQQNNTPDPDSDIVVAMIHSLAMKNYPAKLFSDFGMVVVDECHHLSSETFSRCLPKVGFRYTLGLSATPDRKDGLSDVFYSYLGDIFHQERRSGKNSVYVKRFSLSSASSNYEVQYMSNGIKNTSSMVTALSDFETRNMLIMEILAVLCSCDRKILFVSHRREHLDIIKSLMDKYLLKKSDGTPVTYGFYYGRTGGNKKQHREMLEKSAKCDVILGTFHITSEGLDIPDLDTLFLATPANEMEQAVGRILRKYHETRNPWVIDLIDRTGNFPKQGKYRLGYYLDEGYCSQTMPIELPIDSASLQLSGRFDDFLTSNEVDGISRDILKKRVLRGELLETKKKSKNVDPLPEGICLLDDSPNDVPPQRPSLPVPKRRFRPKK